MHSMAESLKTASLIEQLEDSKRLFDDFVSREYAALARIKATSEFESSSAESKWCSGSACLFVCISLPFFFF